MTVAAALRAISNYPIPSATIESIADEAGVGVTAVASRSVRQSREYRRATAYVYRYLAEAPNVTQGGISYIFSEDERNRFARRAAAILEELGEDGGMTVECGYIGEDF